ncbi:MAG TPA: LemA family protein [Candidatus Thermoplasmatota archaeon]|nr:LemA family protein [Candidatus Thermoplasmatota archaeon]
MAFPIWAIVVLVIAVLLFIVWIVSLINSFVRYENAIDNAWAQIDVQLQRRGELIPNLVETVKGYAAHEKTTLDAVIKARSQMVSATSREGKMQAEGMLEGALGKLFALAEAYPDLKANTNFLQLQDELGHTENKVAYARQAYNDSVLRYNNAIETIPAKWFAGSRTEKPMLSAPEATRAVPKVQF